MLQWINDALKVRYTDKEEKDKKWKGILWKSSSLLDCRMTIVEQANDS